MTTFGRGLDLVAMMSSRWGSDLAHDGRSKSVWFEPSGDARVEAHLEGEIFDFDPELADGPEIIERRPDADHAAAACPPRCSASCAATTSRYAGSCACSR